MPYWKVLIKNDEARKTLQSQGGEALISGSGATEIVLTNQSMERLVSIMWGLYQLGPPFIDETGIEGNIDITLEGVLTDFEDFKKALERNGLKLEKGKKTMKVIVIRDPVTE